MTDHKMLAFDGAMSGLKTAMFALGLHSTGLVPHDAESLRKYAGHARAMAKAFDALMEAGGALVGAESWDRIAEIAAREDYAPSLEAQARKLEDDEEERQDQYRWEREHKQLVDPPRD